MTRYNLKAVKADDCDLVLKMRNQDFVRKNMLAQNVIDLEEHRKWFADILNAEDKKYFLFIVDNTPSGVIGFFNLDTLNPDWSFYLGVEGLPKGTGTILCKLGIEWLSCNYSGSRLTTKVLKSNVKSLKIHEKLGFMKIEDNNVDLAYAQWQTLQLIL